MVPDWLGAGCGMRCWRSPRSRLYLTDTAALSIGAGVAARTFVSPQAGVNLPSETGLKSLTAALARWSPWVIGSALSLLMFWVDFTHSDGGSLDGKAFWGRDFVN